MARAHLFRPVTNGDGVPLYGAKVTVRSVDLSGNITQTVWDGPLNTAMAQGNPITINGGYIDIWLDYPQRVNLLIQQPGADDISVFMDVSAPADQVIQSDQPLRVTGDMSAGQVLLAVDSNTASFGDAPLSAPSGTVPAHQHEGDGANSVALGVSAVASGTNSTAYGVQATASNTDSTAVGYQSNSTGVGAVAVGSGAGATGDDGVAVGYQAQAVSGSVAVGSGSSSEGVRGTAVGTNSLTQNGGSVAVGYGAQSVGVDSVAIGDNAQAQGDQSIAIGGSAVAAYDRSTAIGNGAVTNSVDQLVLGTATQTVVLPGTLMVQGDARIGAGGNTIGFFGSYGSAKQTVTGSDGGNLVLRGLIQYLAALGIITDSTTQG